MNKIVGNTTATPMPIADWNQTDEKKADFIKHKPDIDGKINEVKNDITELQKSLNGKADGFTVENIQKEVENISEDVNKNKSDLAAMSNELSKTSSALPFKADKSSLEATQGEVAQHAGDNDAHVTPEDKQKWNDKYTKEETDEKIEKLRDDLPYAFVWEDVLCIDNTRYELFG